MSGGDGGPCWDEPYSINEGGGVYPFRYTPPPLFPFRILPRLVDEDCAKDRHPAQRPSGPARMSGPRTRSAGPEDHTPGPAHSHFPPTASRPACPPFPRDLRLA